ncbi:unnamed protein product [Pleuronectes platessa]|uniref:Uncharacterized protein n=1 Tax=Pleuronectes platessa TaxID=8262 RepID=A0A9N7YHI1_PLEPL|nr:unnamed protein product [Pleuronectes platessa]
MRTESSCPPSLQGFWKSGHQLQPTRPSQTLLQSTSRPSIQLPQPPTPLSLSQPGSTTFPLVIAVRRPVMCHKWDKLQRLGDARVGGCEWVAMTGRARERDRKPSTSLRRSSLKSTALRRLPMHRPIIDGFGDER